jgi:phosphate/sulfate permease
MFFNAFSAKRRIAQSFTAGANSVKNALGRFNVLLTNWLKPLGLEARFNGLNDFR